MLQLNTTKSILFSLLLCLSMIACTKQDASKEGISFAVKSNDSLHLKTILLTGSSTFTRWVDAQLFFPNHIIVNKAFGGSMLKDIFYQIASYTVFNPDVVVHYCGMNNALLNQTSTEMFTLFKGNFYETRKWMPNAKFINMGLTIPPVANKINTRTGLPIRSTIENYNRLVREFLATQPNAEHIEMYSYFFLYPQRVPNPNWFLQDSLHQPHAAYQIWADKMTPAF